ncbi:MAG: hypothetical protein JW734_09110 [Candidatus Omnitrophica bacterium]|nr:hypothetical protein [Candidatus Omnitrophota bacterium]
MRKLTFLFIAVCLFMSFMYFCYAQTIVYLKSGKSVEGELLERTDEYIKIDFSGVKLTYWMDEVERIQLSDGKVIYPQQKTLPAKTEEGELIKKLPVDDIATLPFTDDELEREQDDLASVESGNESVDSKLEELKKKISEISQRAKETPEDESSRESYIEDLRKRIEDMPKDKAFVFDDNAGLKEGSKLAKPGMGPSGSLLFSSLAFIPVVLIFLVYCFFSYCLQTIARKTGIPNGWFGWIPILNFILMCDIAGKPRWWTASLLLSFIPFLGALAVLVVGVILWMKIAEARNKPAWWGVLTVLPLINLAAVGYIALSD